MIHTIATVAGAVGLLLSVAMCSAGSVTAGQALIAGLCCTAGIVTAIWYKVLTRQDNKE